MNYEKIPDMGVVRRLIMSLEKEDGAKSCGQAAYVIYNQSAESYLKFKSGFEMTQNLFFNQMEQIRGCKREVPAVYRF